MVRIRLRRVGKRKQPVYRVVVADARSPRDGRFIEAIGQYKPLNDPSEIVIDNNKALDWLRKGAQPSDQVKALLKRTGIWSDYVKDRGPAKRKPKRRKAEPQVAKAKAKAKTKAKTKAEEAAAPVEAEAAPQEAAPELEPTTEPTTQE